MRYLPRIRFRLFGSGTPRRSGSVYISVLGVAMIVAVCALSGMHLARSELRDAQRGNDLHRAQWLAASAVELAVAKMNRPPLNNGRWRTALTHGEETEPIAVGDGTMSFKLVSDDGNLTTDPTDPVWIYGYGRVGQAVWVQRARARHDGGLPLEALNTCLHSSGGISIQMLGELSVFDAPASTDRSLEVQGILRGDAHAVTRTGSGIITGVTTVPAERKGVPWPQVLNDYVAKATELPFQGAMNRVVLAPGVNQYGGGLNPRGIYYINTGGGNLTIARSRLLGTLIVDAGNGTVSIENSCFMEPYRPDFPVLLIKGTTNLALRSTGGNQFLRESREGHNYNPPGAPYQGQTNNDQRDSYPSEIRGLIHVIGDVTFADSGVYRGAVLVQGKVQIGMLRNPRIYHDRDLIINPPWGYSSDPNNTSMIVQPRTWTRQPSS